MMECDRDKYVRVVYKYQQEIPLKNGQISRNYNIDQVASMPDDVLSKYYYFIQERLNVIAALTKKQDEEKLTTAEEIDDAMQQYLVDTYEIDNGPDEEPTMYKENFLGVTEPNQVGKLLSRIKK